MAGEEGIPQGLKPLSSSFVERPKAEALGYLEAKAEHHAYWMKRDCKGKDKSRSLRDDKQKEQATADADPLWG
jgi:hypothetical protein